MWSIVSHIIPYYFNSWGTGSHLYTANANTLRSVHRNKDLLALVGTHISWLPCPPLLYLDYITNLAICQDLFEKKFAGGATRTHIIPLPTQPKTPATDGRTRLERVEWHTGGLSATDAHHLRFFAKSYIFPRRYLARTSWQFFLSNGF